MGKFHHLTSKFIFLLGLIFTVFGSLAAFRENLGSIFSNRLPLAGDGSFTAIFLKLLKESSFWELFSQNFYSYQLGWPESINFTSYPVGNTFDLLFLKIIMTVSPSIEISNLIHLVSILKVIPIYIATYWFCRKLFIWKPSAALCGVLFALSSYNLIRAEGHFFLGFTWTVPLGLFVLIKSFRHITDSATAPSLTLREKIELAVCTLLVGYTSFYYSFFFIFIGTIVLVMLLVRDSLIFLKQKGTQEFQIEALKRILLKFLVPVSSLSGIVLGLFMQIFPVVLHQNSTIASTQTSDRSFTEPIVYGGTVQSLFFDFTKLTLHSLRREDILNFLRTQISWEGSQVGAFTGAFLFFLILLVIASLALGRIAITLHSNLHVVRLLFVFLIVTLLLYFPSPVNFIINSYLPQIRAWGRISVLITLIVLTLAFLSIQSIKVSKYLAALLAIGIALPGLAEVASFRLARPPSIDISASAAATSSSRSESLKSLRTVYQESCALSIIPITPFPEFDNPQDNAGDYAYFDLPLSDAGYFNWVNGAFKNTWDGRFLEPLFSQQPNFVRTNLEYTVSYLKQLGVCGAIIDRTSLIPVERSEFENVFLSSKSSYAPCVKELPGEIFDNSSRFYSVDLQNDACIFKENKSAEFLAFQNSKNDFVWRVDSPYSTGYRGGIQTFSSTEAIDFRIKLRDENPGNNIGLFVELFSGSTPSQSFTEEICVMQKSEAPVEKCQSPFRLDSGFGISITSELKARELYEFKVRLKGPSPGISSWGIFLVTLPDG